jgi:uncharacterized repeat protein (TIGR02543 family)
MKNRNTLLALILPAVLACLFSACAEVYKPQVRGIKVTPETLILQKDEIVDFPKIIAMPSSVKEPPVRWESDDPSVVEIVSGDGSGVKAVANGRATITAITENDLTAECVVIVGYVTVTFDKNNTDSGNVYAEKKVLYGTYYLDELPAAPTRNGYIFTGWYTVSGERFTVNTQVTVDITVYAHWETGSTEPENVIAIAAIQGVTAPVTDATPVTEITETAQYTGTVSWQDESGNDLSGKFAASTVYTATITLTPKKGFTLQGVAADLFTVAGANSVTNTANSGIVTVVFPTTAGDATDPAVIDIAAIQGVTAPVTDATPVTEITQTAQYTGTVDWSPTIASGDKFAASTVYTATITLAAKTGFTFTGVGANFGFTLTGVTGATVSNTADSGDTCTVTAVFPSTTDP